MAFDLNEKSMERTAHGRLALQKFGNVPENFRLFDAGLQPEDPVNWVRMRVTGAEFRAAKTGPNKGKLTQLLAGTTRTVVLERHELEAFGQHESNAGQTGAL